MNSFKAGFEKHDGSKPPMPRSRQVTTDKSRTKFPMATPHLGGLELVEKTPYGRLSSVKSEFSGISTQERVILSLHTSVELA